jgi:hypothetical protein
MADIKTTPPTQAAAQPPAAPPKAADAGGVLGMLGIGALKEKVLGIVKAGPQQLDICLLNRGLMVIIGVIIICFIRSMSVSLTELKNEGAKQYSISPATKAESGFKEIATMKGVAYYIGKLAGRDIFHRQAKPNAALNEPVFSTKMADMTATLKLVGISMSDNPDAMIEDTKLEKTFFVKAGSMIGDLRVDEITKDKVVLKYNKELFELK